MIALNFFVSLILFWCRHTCLLNEIVSSLFLAILMAKWVKQLSAVWEAIVQTTGMSHQSVVTTLPDAWLYMVSAWGGWPTIGIQWDPLIRKSSGPGFRFSYKRVLF